MIYIINAIGTNLYKIGYTGRNVVTRLASLQTGCPNKLAITATLDGDETDEAELHRLVWQHHIQGEWFQLDTRALEGIVENGKRFIPHQCSTQRDSPHDVRPLCRGQFYTITDGGENVSDRQTAVDHTRNQHSLITLRGKY